MDTRQESTISTWGEFGMSEQVYVGIDVGGTTIKIGLCNSQGELLQTYEGPTGTEEGSEVVLENIAIYARKVVELSPYSWEQVAGCGVGFPGFMDIPNGIVKFAANLRWENVHARDILAEKLQKPIQINNDANIAALGEAWAGAGKDVRNLVMFTLGTGVGGGIIIDGRIYEGYNGMAGELGHIQIVPDLEAIGCGCGQTGCLETVSSATGIIRMAADAIERKEKTSLALHEQITAKDVLDAAREGDEVAIRIVKRAAYYLGRTMAMLAVVLNPERYVIGGGVSKAGDILFDPIREVFAKYAPPNMQEGVDIIPAVLGNDAGVVGAAGLHLRQK